LGEGNSQRDWRKEEYRSLAQEMIHNREKQAQAFIVGLLAAGALLGFAASSHGTLPPLTFLLPVTILVPVSLIIISLRNATDRIQAYIRVRFTASDTKLRYEECIPRFRWPARIVVYLPIFKLMVCSNLTISLASTAAAIYSAQFYHEKVGLDTIVLSAVALLTVVLVLLSLLASDLICKPMRLEKAWRDALHCE